MQNDNKKKYKAVFLSRICQLLATLGALLCLAQIYTWTLNQQDQLALVSTALASCLALFCFFINRCRISSLLLIYLLLWISFDWLYNYGNPGLSLTVSALLLAFDIKATSFEANRKKDPINASLYFLFFATLIFELFQNLDFKKSGLLETTQFSPLVFYFTIIAYSFCQVRKFENAKRLICGAVLVFLLQFVFFTQVMQHEYFYYFSGKAKFTLHPEFIVACHFVLIGLICLLIYNFIFSKKGRFLVFLTGTFTLLIYCLFAPTYEIPSWLKDNNLTGNLSNWQMFFGVGADWKGHILRKYNVYKPGQLPLPTIDILQLKGGYFLLGGFFLLLITAFQQTLFKYKKPTLSIVIILLIGGLFYIPLLSDPISILVATILFSSINVDNKSNAKPIFEATYQKFIIVGFQSLILVGILYISYQAFAAYIKVSAGTRYPNLDLNYTTPTYLAEYVLASEDLLFFEHQGVDFARLKWTLRDTLKSMSIDKGASTISMQLAKVSYLEFDKTFGRKIQQILIAFYFEFTKSKSEILKTYLASLGYAEHSHGIVTASKNFFDKTVRDLNPDQSLRLVMSIPDPSFFNATMPIDSRHEKLAASIHERARNFRNALKVGISKLDFVDAGNE